MSRLTVYHLSTPDIPNKVLTHFEDIAATLAEQGIAFTHWNAAGSFKPGTPGEHLLEAYRGELEGVMNEAGYAVVEPLSVDMQPDGDGRQPAQFREEAHSYLIASGRVLLNLWIGDYVYAVVCEKHDQLSVPAKVVHWCDLGERPFLAALRLCKTEQGRIAHTADENVAERFPRLED